MYIIRVSLIIFPIILFIGCSSFFLYSEDEKLIYPQNIVYKDIYSLSEGKKLHGWLVQTVQEKKGVVLYIHGNKENIGSQINRVSWLIDFGYDVIAFDYKGFGCSEGKASVKGAMSDIKSMYDWTIKHTDKDESIYIFAQSIGGAMAITVLADYLQKGRFTKIIVDSAFSSFSKIAREFARENILTKLFVPMAKTLITDRYSPINYIQKISPTPIVIMHGDNDQTINVVHANQLYNYALEPKKLWIQKGYDHINALNDSKIRSDFVKLLNP